MTMKRTLIGLCAVFCLILAGCGESAPEVRPFENGDLNTILESGAFSEQLEVVDSEIVCMLYGMELGGDIVTACEGYLSGGATAEELVLFTAVDEGAAEKVKAACELRVEDQIVSYESYLPGEVAKLENAVIAVRGNTVLIVVANDGAAVASVVDGLN